ncbi:hypothetical protein NEUTE1DRAFT_44315, partial [Neurospora tetrasperma FGSC 2508]
NSINNYVILKVLINIVRNKNKKVIIIRVQPRKKRDGENRSLFLIEVATSKAANFL